MKITIKKRTGKKFPYYYSQDPTIEFGDYKYVRTYYFMKWAIVISLIKYK